MDSNGWIIIQGHDIILRKKLRGLALVHLELDLSLIVAMLMLQRKVKHPAELSSRITTPGKGLLLFSWGHLLFTWVAYQRLAVLGEHDVRIRSFHSTAHNCFPRARLLAEKSRDRGYRRAIAPRCSLLAAHRDSAGLKLLHPLHDWVLVCFHSPG